MQKGRKLSRKMNFQGLPISIETDKGEKREWYDPHNDEHGVTVFEVPYGYFTGLNQLGNDGDQLDTFVGPDAESDKVFCIRQNKKDEDGEFGAYDETKVVLGCNSAKEAKDLYLRHYDNPKFFRDMYEMPIDAFKEVFMKALNANGLNFYDVNQVQNLLNNIGSLKDTDLVTLQEQIWGPNTASYTNSTLNQLKAETMGFLMDQLELLQNQNNQQMTGMMQPTQDTTALPHSSISSQNSTIGQTNEEQLPEGNSSEEGSISEPSNDLETQESSQSQNQDQVDPTSSTKTSSKDLENEAVKAIQLEPLELIFKASKPYDKLSGHKYSHKDGNNFYYTDQTGNYLKYTNAPEDHQDYDSMSGSPYLHDSEPDATSNPEYFTPDGRKLTRAPFPGSQLEWNPSYHSSDPKNLWAGRWVNPVSGDHEYTYVDSDIRGKNTLQLNRQNTVVDLRLPEFRKYIYNLFRSQSLKDNVMGLVLALIDQARFRVMEIVSLTPSSVSFSNGLMKLGNRTILPDEWVLKLFQVILNGRQDNHPLFLVTNNQGTGLGFGSAHHIGPNMVMKVMESFGLPIEFLQTYHATELYSRTMNKLLSMYNMTLEEAEMYSLYMVALDMGVDLSMSPDFQQAFNMIKETSIDPVVAEAIGSNFVGNPNKMPFDPSSLTAPIYYVNVHMTGKTPEEVEFSRWLHTYPAHLHA